MTQKLTGTLKMSKQIHYKISSPDETAKEIAKNIKAKNGLILISSTEINDENAIRTALVNPTEIKAALVTHAIKGGDPGTTLKYIDEVIEVLMDASQSIETRMNQLGKLN